MKLKDKVVVVTGGSGVLCSAMAIHLAKLGGKVAVIGRTQSKLDAVVSEISSLGGTAIAVSADVLDEDAINKAHQTIRKELGACDILINGAGGNHPSATTSQERFSEDQNDGKTFFDMSPDAFGSVFDLNFKGSFIPTQVFAKDMVGRDGCTVINLSSMSAYSPMTKVPAYSAAKAAISNFTEWMAVHFASANIRVNAIAPGFFLTEQNRALLTQENGDLTERGNTIISQTPMRRFGKPEELLGTLEWLCTDASAFVTGTVIPVDGGFNAFSGV